MRRLICNAYLLGLPLTLSLHSTCTSWLRNCGGNSALCALCSSSSHVRHLALENGWRPPRSSRQKLATLRLARPGKLRCAEPSVPMRIGSTTTRRKAMANRVQRFDALPMSVTLPMRLGGRHGGCTMGSPGLANSEDCIRMWSGICCVAVDDQAGRSPIGLCPRARRSLRTLSCVVPRRLVKRGPGQITGTA